MRVLKHPPHAISIVLCNPGNSGGEQDNWVAAGTLKVAPGTLDTVWELRGSKVFLGTAAVCKKQASVLKVLVNCEPWHCPQNAFTLWMNIFSVIMSDQPWVVGFAGELIFHRELGTKWCDRAMGGGGGGVPVSLGWNRSDLLDEHIGGWTLTDTCCCARSCCLLSHISVKVFTHVNDYCPY